MTIADGDGARTATVTAPRQPRALLLAFNHRPHDRVLALAERLLDEGARLDVVVLSEGNWAELAGRPGLRLFTIGAAEKRHPLLRAERLVVTSGPRRVAGGLGRLAGKSVAGGLRRRQERLSRAFHKRVFMKAYTNVRPMVLSKLALKRLSELDLDRDPADLIVASDALSITLGWQLARRYPGVVATTSLDPPPLAQITAAA
ncbi:hypothetical protein CO540_09140 [Micromonospora sp. WMMA2032]|uniref:hypothetical protein n=1 Tax=Micromonospora TaxID=1873 RepID=UPI000C05A12E|nr:hypothetical protein [Micromonospora sp. WMMA2032]ATO13976.1 hypothetical protein CO540_09140 [Micromonospora sp. WMMA2032]